MKKLLITKNNQRKVIKKAVKVLKNGGVIVYPTETAYGLGADFFNRESVNKVYKIKGRPYNKPLPLMVSSFKMAREIVRFNQVSLRLAKKYWPGPLTLISNIQFPISNKFGIKNLKLNKNYKTLGLRISSNRLATAIVRKLGRPLTATSANVSGKSECFAVDDVINQFRNKKNQPDLIIDAGKLPIKKPSTVVKVVDDQVEVLRRGEILL